MKSKLFFLTALAAFSFCKKTEKRADAFGNFEAVETIVAAESTGKILAFSVEEGQEIAVGQSLGQIETEQIRLKKGQLEAAIRAVRAKNPDAAAPSRVFDRQIAAQNQQLLTLEKERKRAENLVKAGAAPSKTLDDLTAQIELLQKQIEATREQQSASNTAISTQKTGLFAEIEPLQKQIDQLEDQLGKGKIQSPVAGTVLSKFAETGEIAVAGKALFKVADLRKMTLRAFVAGDQLAAVKIGQTVKILIDGPEKTSLEKTGKIQWISPRAEFTPKVIQTKNERVNLVYAVKIEVENSDGSLKIGMPAEVIF